jgi:hypothetical protein
MRTFYTLTAGLLLGTVVPSLCAQEIQTTTEFGITITPEQVMDAIQESADFWPPVNKLIAGDQFKVGEPWAREKAASFIKRVQDHLYEQTMSEEEKVVLDLIDYLTCRMRMIELYREMRKVVGDDLTVAQLKAEWERQYRDARSLPEAECALVQAKIVSNMRREMEIAAVKADALEPAMKIWERLAECTVRLNGSQTGLAILEYEKEAKAAEVKVGVIIRDVVAAADWALVSRKEGTTASKEDFNRAWQELKPMRTPTVVVGAGGM